MAPTSRGGRDGLLVVASWRSSRSAADRGADASACVRLAFGNGVTAVDGFLGARAPRAGRRRAPSWSRSTVAELAGLAAAQAATLDA